MEENKNIPELRFPEFEGEWRGSELGKEAAFSKGKGVAKSDISEEGATPCIRYGELYTKYSELIDEVHSKTSVPKAQLVLSRHNDIVIPASGESALDIATASCVIPKGVALGGDLNIIRTDIYGIFLAYYLNNRKKKDIARFAQGISVIHLYSSQLKLLPLLIPTHPEQQKIADFLTSVDKKIGLLKSKKEKLGEYKKGLLQQIFSQQLRFKDEQGNPFPEWEEKKLGEVAYKKKEKNRNQKHTLVLTNSATQGIVSQREYFDKDIANENNLSGYYIVEVNDFVYNPRISEFALVGPVKRNKLALGIMSPLYTVFAFKYGILAFFEGYFATRHWHRYMNSVANFGARYDRMNITMKDLFSLPLPFPSLPEQRKIADFLQSVDIKIELLEKELAGMQEWKKGLLQKMFV